MKQNKTKICFGYKSNIAGRCYTICSQRNADKVDGSYIYLKRNLDLILYVHTNGDEFWLNGPTVFPVKVEVAELKMLDGFAGLLNMELADCN